MEETIDLREYFAIIKKRFWIIALLAIISALISGVISFFMLNPVYEAKSTLIVNADKQAETQIVTGDQITVTQKLAVTYGEIIKSRIVLDDVIKNLKLENTYESLSGQITVSPVKDTQIISISVQDTNPQKARDIANEIPKVFAKEAKRITKANDIQVIDKAILPKDAVKPNKMMNIAIAAVLGMMIGLFIVFLIEYLDNKIKTPQDIEKHLGLSVIGVIPNEDIA